MTKKINRDELTKWAKETKDSFFENNGLIYIENCFVYPFILGLSIDDWEVCTDDEIKNYLSVLIGEKSFNYFWYMKLPQDSTRSKILNSVNDLLKEYDKTGQMGRNSEKILNELEIQKDILRMESLFDVLSSDIINIVLGLPFKKGLDFNFNSCYFDIDKLSVNGFVEKAFDLCKCYFGEKSFGVSVYYGNGDKIITVLV